MQTKRVNIFSNFENPDPRPKKKNRHVPWCARHSRYCGPYHERFWIEEEQRWMHSWEEYKYLQTKDYYVVKPVSFCAWDKTKLCVMCGWNYASHIDGFCANKSLSVAYNKYTECVVGVPVIYDTDDVLEGRKTQ